MDTLEIGTLVRSLAGRDKGSILAVVGYCDKGVLVCDGKERPVERPKSKNIRHLEVLGKSIADEQLKTNRALRKALAEFK